MMETMHGPLNKYEAGEVARHLNRMPVSMEKYPRLYPTRAAFLRERATEHAEQVAYSALFAPDQVTMWAWAVLGFTRELEAELAAVNARTALRSTA